MARESTEQAEIQKLIQVSAQAREQLGVTVGRIRRGIDVPAKLFGSLRKRPKSWLFGSMAAGLATSYLLSKLPRRKKGFGLKRKALSLTLTAARPLAKVWLTNKLRDLGSQWVSNRVAARKAPASPFQIEPATKPSNVRTPGS